MSEDKNIEEMSLVELRRYARDLEQLLFINSATCNSNFNIAQHYKEIGEERRNLLYLHQNYNDTLREERDELYRQVDNKEISLRAVENYGTGEIEKLKAELSKADETIRELRRNVSELKSVVIE